MFILSQYQIKTPKFQVFEDLVGVWTLRHNMKKKRWRWKGEHTLGHPPYNKVSPSITASEPWMNWIKKQQQGAVGVLKITFAKKKTTAHQPWLYIQERHCAIGDELNKGRFAESQLTTLKRFSSEILKSIKIEFLYYLDIEN